MSMRTGSASRVRSRFALAVLPALIGIGTIKQASSASLFVVNLECGGNYLGQCWLDPAGENFFHTYAQQFLPSVNPADTVYGSVTVWLSSCYGEFWQHTATVFRQSLPPFAKYYQWSPAVYAGSECGSGCAPP
jgi:hypothetical protein